MTERDPDPLFDALRERLGAHERPPTTDSWAALAAQLATHRQRQLRRRAGWALGGLLVLALIGWLSAVWSPHPVADGVTRSVEETHRSTRPALHGTEMAPRSIGKHRQSAGEEPRSALAGEPLQSIGEVSQSISPAPQSNGVIAHSIGKEHLSSGETPAMTPAPLPTAPDSAAEILTTAPTRRVRQATARLATIPATPSRATIAERAPNEPALLAVPVNSSLPRSALPTGAAPELFAFAELRPVGLQLDSFQRTWLVPTLVADSAYPVPPPIAPRWSFGLALGFDLTHRRLTRSEAGPLAQIERAGGAGQAAISIGYSITPRLRVRAGVGYAAYRQSIRASLVRQGTTLAYVEQIIPGPDGQLIRTLSWQWVPTDSVLGRQTTRAQPTARYLTVPLLAEWQLRSPAPRWRPVLAAGLTPHVLLRARTATLTRDCNCEAAPAELRRFALGLSAEAGIDYALQPDLWLTLRPAATYLLTNTAAPDQPTRYPWRVGLSVGLRWNRPPRADAR